MHLTNIGGVHHCTHLIVDVSSKLLDDHPKRVYVIDMSVFFLLGLFGTCIWLWSFAKIVYLGWEFTWVQCVSHRGRLRKSIY